MMRLLVVVLLSLSTNVFATEYAVIDKYNPPVGVLELLSRVTTELGVEPPTDGRVDGATAQKIRSALEELVVTKSRPAENLPQATDAGRAAARAAMDAAPVAGFIGERMVEYQPMPTEYGTVLATGFCRRWDRRTGNCKDCDLPTMAERSVAGEPSSPGAMATDFRRCVVTYEALGSNGERALEAARAAAEESRLRDEAEEEAARASEGQPKPQSVPAGPLVPQGLLEPRGSVP
jgi:hypothetical protein